MSNKVYLSSIAAIKLDAYNEVTEKIFKGRQDIIDNDLQKSVYRTVLQIGIDNIAMREGLIKGVKNDIVLKNRITDIPSQLERKYLGLFYRAIEYYTQKSWQETHRLEAYKPLYKIIDFIIDVCVAMELNRNLIFWGEMPRCGEADGLLPAEMLNPIYVVLSTFVEIKTNGPMPTAEIEKGEIVKFNQVFSSVLYENLCRSHASIAYDENLEKCLGKITTSCNKLVRKFPDILASEKITPHIVDMTPKFIDTVFGKLPGIIAKPICDIAYIYLKNRKRLVVYNTQALANTLLMQNYKFYCEGRVANR